MTECEHDFSQPHPDTRAQDTHYFCKKCHNGFNKRGYDEGIKQGNLKLASQKAELEEKADKDMTWINASNGETGYSLKFKDEDWKQIWAKRKS